MPLLTQSELREALARLPEVVNIDALSVGDIWGQNFHSTASHELIHVLQGRARIEFERHSCDVGPGDTFVVPKGTRHKDVRRDDRDYRVLYVFFQWDSGAKLLKHLRPDGLAGAPESAKPHLHLLFNQIQSEFAEDGQSAAESKQRLSMMLLEILLAMLRYAAKPETVRVSDARQAIARRKREGLAAGVRKHLAEHCGESLSLDGIAEQFGVSPFHLSRSFSQQYGMPLIEMLTMLRIDKAADLLKEGRLSVKEVAAAAGIPDANYFAKVFRRVRGQSPSEFQAQAASRSGHR